MSIESAGGEAKEASVDEVQHERRQRFLEPGWVVYGEARYNSRMAGEPRNRYLLVQMDSHRIDERVFPHQAAKHVVVVDMGTGLVEEPLPDARLMWDGQWREPDMDLTVEGILADPELEFGELLEW